MKRILVLLLTALPALAGAQAMDLRLPISLDADSTDYDGKNSMLMFRGLRLTQGNIGVVADLGRASKLDFQDSVWRFEGNVVIDVDDGHIECDAADLQFSEHQLRIATIQGSPATFRLRRPGSNETTYAEAGRLEYDLRTGIVEFSQDARITEGGNQISSNFLVYNIREQRIKAESSGGDDEKVKITYTPADPPAGLGIEPVEADKDDTEAQEPNP
jgi:lipopolysaccharide transport protein LptA